MSHTGPTETPRKIKIKGSGWVVPSQSNLDRRTLIPWRNRTSSPWIAVELHFAGQVFPSTGLLSEWKADLAEGGLGNKSFNFPLKLMAKIQWARKDFLSSPPRIPSSGRIWYWPELEVYPSVEWHYVSQTAGWASPVHYRPLSGGLCSYYFKSL